MIQPFFLGNDFRLDKNYRIVANCSKQSQPQRKLWQRTAIRRLLL